jgi:hypothetical protein
MPDQDFAGRIAIPCIGFIYESGDIKFLMEVRRDPLK